MDPPPPVAPSAGAALPAMGDIIAGKYRVQEVLGVGGMGAVVAAVHVHLEQRVAIKFLLPELATNQVNVNRFLREAKATVKIRTEHVVKVYDVGVEGGAPFMVLELLEGHDLATELAAGNLPPATAVEYILQAGEAMVAAHALGIIHRDLKPSNLFLTRRRDGTPCVKVVDFGISKLAPHAIATSAPLALTKTEAVIGSPLYMAPEQMRCARDVDARTDIWALGVILYELIAGDPPFMGETVHEVAAAVLKDPAPPIRMAAPDVPHGLEAVILRCLNKEPEGRFGSVTELMAALRPFVSAGGPISPLASQPVLENPLPSHSGEPAPGHGTSPGAGRWFAIAALTMTVLMIIGVAGILAAKTNWLRRTSVAREATSSGEGPSYATAATNEARRPNPDPALATSSSSAADSAGSGAPQPTPLPSSRASSAASLATTVPSSAKSVATGSRATKPVANCSPPFYFDHEGNRIFKKECL